MFSNHKECHAQKGGSCKLLKHELHHGAKLDRCEGMEFDAVAVNEEGIPYFFKGERWYIREVRLLSVRNK